MHLDRAKLRAKERQAAPLPLGVGLLAWDSGSESVCWSFTVFGEGVSSWEPKTSFVRPWVHI